MSNAAYRRQAEFLIRLSQTCPDQLIADHLRATAANYLEKALELEFGLSGTSMTVHPDSPDPERTWH